MFVIVQSISAEVHDDFVIVHYSANVSIFGEMQAIQAIVHTKSKVKFPYIFLQFDTYISTEYLLAYLKAFIS